MGPLSLFSHLKLASLRLLFLFASFFSSERPTRASELPDSVTCLIFFSLLLSSVSLLSGGAPSGVLLLPPPPVSVSRQPIELEIQFPATCFSMSASGSETESGDVNKQMLARQRKKKLLFFLARNVDTLPNR